MSDFTDQSSAIYLDSNYWRRAYPDTETCAIVTVHGYVSAMLWVGDRMDGLRLEFIYGGREYTRQWDRSFSHRYAITLARRFVREIVAEASA